MGDFSLNRSNRVRLSRFLKGKDVVLRGISALQYMELFVEDHFSFDAAKACIFVYSTEEMTEGNFDVKRVDDFSNIDYNDEWDILCATLSQVVNDVLAEPALMHQAILVEALANHYEEQGHFGEIEVEAVHQAEFEQLKALAVKFYD
ncbi:MAG: hypothetical protein FWG67_09325 [Defluviitaleaceae bacterium]|nr:hypothetical protein [Defluviitaleaceae bacterium]